MCCFLLNDLPGNNQVFHSRESKLNFDSLYLSAISQSPHLSPTIIYLYLLFDKNIDAVVGRCALVMPVILYNAVG